MVPFASSRRTAVPLKSALQRSGAAIRPHLVWVYAAYCVSYLLAIAQYLMAMAHYPSASSWPRQLLALLCLAFLMALSLPIVSIRAAGILVALQTVFLFILTLPGQIGSTVIAAASVSIAIQLNLFFRPKRALVLSLLAAAALFLACAPGGDGGGFGGLLDRVELLLLLPAGAALLTHLLRRGYLLVDEEALRIGELQAGINRVAKANVSFQQYAEEIKRESAEEERRQITRDIHDTIGFTLTNVIMMLEDASINLSDDADALAKTVRSACDLSRQGLSNIRHELRLLRGIQAPVDSGMRAIRKMIHNFEHVTGVGIHVDYANFPESVGQALDLFLYHFVQEGMVNAVRHGKTSEVAIYFWLGEREVVVSLSDNGGGSADQQSGLGLIGLQERISLLGGTLTYGNFDSGFRLIARLPVAQRGRTDG